MEVMMMPFVGTFIPWSLSMDLHAADLALFLKGFERSIDSRYPERGNALQGKGMDLVRQERVLLFGQDGLDRLLLFGGASFDGQRF